MSAADAGTLLERADAMATLTEWEREHTDPETGELPEWLVELRDAATLSLKEKVERAAMAAKRQLAEADVIDAELKRLQARKAARCNAAERIKTYLRICLEMAGETKVESPLVTVALQANGGAQPIRWTRDLAELPELFRRNVPATFTLDATTAQAVFKRDGTLPEGFEVLPRGTSLRIR